MLRITEVTLCLAFLLCCVVALPHCERTEVPQRLIADNVINIIYTMESSCKICVQQASRLPRLKRYLERKGIKSHLVIGVSKGGERLGGLVPHIEVNSRHVWRSLGKQNNHFYIIDRCGRLVYEVINPWSNLNLTFVKAAVAATAHSHPCGLCPVDYLQVPKDEEIQEFPSLSSYSEPLPGDISPLMNIRLRHKHRGDPNIYNYIVKVAGLPHFHGHIPHDRGTGAQSVPTVDITTTEKPEVTQTEESSVFTSRTTRLNPTESSASSEYSRGSTSRSVRHPGESSTSNYLREPSTVDGEGQSTEPSTNSISYSLSKEVQHRPKDLADSVNVNLSETSHDKNRTETTTENIQSDDSENAGTTPSEGTESNEYDDDYEKRDEELTSEEEAELVNLRVHYRRIIDWMDFFSDENYDY